MLMIPPARLTLQVTARSQRTTPGRMTPYKCRMPIQRNCTRIQYRIKHIIQKLINSDIQNQNLYMKTKIKKHFETTGDLLALPGILWMITLIYLIIQLLKA